MTQPALHHLELPATDPARRMAWWQWGDAQAGHVLMCVHGLSRQGRDFDVLAQALLARAAAQGRALRVVCPDVAGRGRSDWLPDAAQYQFPQYLADMAALLAALHAAAPVLRLDWVGTSMGGLIGLMLAATGDALQPAPVSHLVLNDVGPRIEWAGMAHIGQRLAAAGPTTPAFASLEEGVQALRAQAQAFGPHTDAQWRQLMQPMLHPAAQGGWRLHYDPAIAQGVQQLSEEALAQTEALLWPLYDQVRAPTLVLRGAASDVFSKSCYEICCIFIYYKPCYDIIIQIFIFKNCKNCWFNYKYSNSGFSLHGTPWNSTYGK